MVLERSARGCAGQCPGGQSMPEARLQVQKPVELLLRNCLPITDLQGCSGVNRHELQHSISAMGCDACNDCKSPVIMLTELEEATQMPLPLLVVQAAGHQRLQST
eukprot:6790576-Lingulodinium_polyedra.AAC.1